MTTDEHLQDIDGQLRRICYELDAIAHAVKKLLEANQCKAEAAVFFERFEAAKHSDERPTLPPPTSKST